MVRLTVMAAIAGVTFGATQVQASSEKTEYCGHQGAIVAALRQAKLDRVSEDKAEAHVIAAATWPARYNAAIPIYVGEVYKLSRRDLKKNDLGAQWRDACLAN